LAEVDSVAAALAGATSVAVDSVVGTSSEPTQATPV